MKFYVLNIFIDLRQVLYIHHNHFFKKLVSQYIKFTYFNWLYNCEKFLLNILQHFNFIL